MRAGLTPTDEQILDYLSRGLYDAEIAVRVSLPINDVKARIARILQREHLIDRAVLLDWWQADEPELPPPPMARANDRTGMWKAHLVGAVVVVAIIVIGIFAIFQPFGDGSSNGDRLPNLDAAINPDASALELATALAGAKAAVATRVAVSTGPDAFTMTNGSLRPGTALLIARDDLARDRSRLERVYIDPADGVTPVTETIWESPKGFHIIDGVADWTGDQIAVVIEGADIFGEPHALVAVGTASGNFARPQAIPSHLYLGFFAGDTVVLTSPTRAIDFSAEAYDPTAQTFVEIPSPPGAVRRAPVAWADIVGYLWLGDEGALIDESGVELVRLAFGPANAVDVTGAVLPPGAMASAEHGSAISWDGSDGRRYLSLFDHARGQATVRDVSLVVRGALGAGAYAGTYCQPQPSCQPVPAMFEDGLLSSAAVIAPTADTGAPMLIGTWLGPFVRVFADAGHCVPLLETIADEDSQLDCARPGQLLALAELVNGNAKTVVGADATYIRVRTATGEPAWAVAQQVAPGVIQ